MAKLNSSRFWISESKLFQNSYKFWWQKIISRFSELTIKLSHFWDTFHCKKYFTVSLNLRDTSKSQEKLYFIEANVFHLLNLIQLDFGLCLWYWEVFVSLGNIDGIVISLSTWSTSGLWLFGRKVCSDVLIWCSDVLFICSDLMF